jgi:hypothetical protein
MSAEIILPACHHFNAEATLQAPKNVSQEANGAIGNRDMAGQTVRVTVETRRKRPRYNFTAGGRESFRRSREAGDSVLVKTEREYSVSCGRNRSNGFLSSCCSSNVECFIRPLAFVVSILSSDPTLLLYCLSVPSFLFVCVLVTVVANIRWRNIRW